jgi:hypothetical protein
MKRELKLQSLQLTLRKKLLKKYSSQEERST